MNLFIIAFINWCIALVVNNDIYNYISIGILVVSLIYMLINVKEVTGCVYKPINFGGKL